VGDAHGVGLVRRDGEPGHVRAEYGPGAGGAAGAGAPPDPGPAGVEALLLLARETPLPASEDLSLRFAGLSRQAGLDPLRTNSAAG
jgi:hypothetical protein